MAKSFNAARSGIFWADLQPRNKTSVTFSSGTQMRQTTTQWKDDLMHLAME
jgi:hypothetical protein